MNNIIKEEDSLKEMVNLNQTSAILVARLSSKVNHLTSQLNALSAENESLKKDLVAKKPVPVENPEYISYPSVNVVDANEVLRSCYAVADRCGENTNWEDLKILIKSALVVTK